MSHHGEHLPHDDVKLDEWHQHTPDEEAPQMEHAAHVNALILTQWYVGLVVSVVAVVVILTIYFTRQVTELRRERIETTAMATEEVEYQNEVEARLEQLGLADAMQQVVEDYARARADGE